MTWEKTVIGRPEHPSLTFDVRLGRVLITGANGSLGSALADRLFNDGIADGVIRTDIETLDVRDASMVRGQFLAYRPDTVFHMAGAKHAPYGEDDPLDVTITNVIGTMNVLKAAKEIGARNVVTASTCKACDPETAYGASKLIAERMTLNYGGKVARYFNVARSSGNVFEIWQRDGGPLKVTDGKRRFITLDEAIDLTVFSAVVNDSGRYAIAGTVSQTMEEVAARLHPDRPIERAPLRRGDRAEEPEMAGCEHGEPMGGWILRVSSPHDPKEKA